MKVRVLSVLVACVAVLAGAVGAVNPVSAMSSREFVSIHTVLTRRSVKPAKATGLKVTVPALPAGGRAMIMVTGPKQSGKKKEKKYSKVIHTTSMLKVRPGVYRITSSSVTVAGGTDVPAVAVKKMRVRNHRVASFTVHYQFVAAPTSVDPAPVTPPPTSSPLSCAQGGACAIGDTGPGGGTVFYIDTTRAAGSQYFEAAPSGWANSQDADPQLLWAVSSQGCDTTDVSGTQTGIGTGAANTNLIIMNPACDSIGKAPAAWTAHDYSGGGKTDWFLPSKDELNQLCKWASGQPTSPDDQTRCTGSSASLNGGLLRQFYWSSSQSSATGARLQSFSAGTQLNISKQSSSVYVRPVREF